MGIVKPLDILATLTAFYASVNVWRGLWSLQSNYFLPGLQQDENYLVSPFLGLFALTLLRVSNTIGNDNIVKDCEAEEVAPINTGASAQAIDLLSRVRRRWCPLWNGTLST